jgi:Tfp pilus assembly protein PilO
VKGTSAKIIVAVVVFLAILAALLVFGILPMTSKLKANQTDLANNAGDLEAAQIKYENLLGLKKNQAEMDKVQSVVMGYLPDDKNSSDFVVKIEAMAKELSLIVPSLSVTEPAPAKAKKSSDDEDSAASSTTKKQAVPQNIVDFTLTFSADYNTAQSFISRLMTFPRLCSLDSIAFTNYSPDSNTLSVRIVGKIYYGK